jgi:hypothetical protein
LKTATAGRRGAAETQRKALTAKARRRKEKPQRKAAKNFRISDFVFLLFSFASRCASAVAVDLFFLAPWRLNILVD